MKRSRKASYLDDETADKIPERRSSCDDERKEKAYERSSCDDEQKEKAHERRRGSHRDSELGQEASDKRKGSLDEDESREKTAQRILR